MTKADRINKFKALSPLPNEVTEELVDKLNVMGYFEAPASTKYHGAYAGGLFDHSLNVFYALESYDRQWVRPDSPFIIAFLHDLCKANQYERTDANSFVYRTDTLLSGHGEKSVMLCNLLPIKLTTEEIACIRYHMGAFVPKEEWSMYTNAIHRFPNVLWVHTADMEATHVIEYNKGRE